MDLCPIPHGAGLCHGCAPFLEPAQLDWRCKDLATLDARGTGVGEAEDDYTSVVCQALGQRWELVAIVSVAVSMFGSLVAYVLFIVENLTRFLSLTPFALAEWQWALICCVPWLLLATSDDVSCLAPFGAVGLACALGFMGVLLYDASSLSWAQLGTFLESTPAVQPNTIFLSISIAAFCNEAVVVMALNIQSQMHSPRRFTSAVVTALIFFAICYLVAGVAGFARFSAHVTSPISDSFDMSALHITAVALYAAQLVPTYPLVAWLTYTLIEQYYLRRCGILSGGTRHAWLKWHRFIPARWAGVLLSAFVALTVHRFGAFLALVGAGANALGIYVLPHGVWLSIFVPRLRDRESRSAALVARAMMSVVVMLFGVVLAIGGTFTAVIAML